MRHFIEKAHCKDPFRFGLDANRRLSTRSDLELKQERTVSLYTKAPSATQRGIYYRRLLRHASSDFKAPCDLFC